MTIALMYYHVGLRKKKRGSEITSSWLSTSSKVGTREFLFNIQDSIDEPVVLSWNGGVGGVLF